MLVAALCCAAAGPSGGELLGAAVAAV